MDIRSSSKVCSYQQKDHDGSESDDEIGLDSIEIEKGKIQRFNNDEDGVKNLEKKLTSFWGGLVTCARLAVMRKNRTESRICPGRLARGLLGSFRKISFYRKKRFYRKKCGDWMVLRLKNVICQLTHALFPRNRLKDEFFLPMPSVCVDPASIEYGTVYGEFPSTLLPPFLFSLSFV